MPSRPLAVPLRDTLVAVLLAGLLVLAWTFRDWAQLSALRLPDTDDAMRLQQIRDWIAGQGFADVSQHRLGPAGLAMHWSRLADLVPALIIAALAPLMGQGAAEIAAVIAWPALLFAVALALTAAIARAVGSSGPVAAVIGALAYPATTLFFPGRIDHHGLQLVLVLVLVRACVGPGTLGRGAAAGLASAASLAIGLETAPLLVVGGGAILLLWLLGRAGAQARLAGYGVALVLGLAGASAVLRTGGWSYPACDGFTAELWRAAQLAALAPLALAIGGFGIQGVRGRVALAVLIGGAALAGAVIVSPGCLQPYGEVDPFLARVWLAHVAEALPLSAAPRSHAIGYAGLMLAGLAAALWLLWRDRRVDAAVLLAFQTMALLVTLAQLRGAYIGAMLAAPALAALIAAARARGMLPLALAWTASAGFVYPMAGDMLMPQPSAADATQDCTAPAALARLQALPPGLLAAPVDLGAWALAATPHRVLAAPYHRNTPGNRAMYRLFLQSPDAAAAEARRLGVSYLAICPDSFDELKPPETSLATALKQGRPPAGLRRLSAPGEIPKVYAVEAAR
jgi:hypothetical protein